MKKALKITGIVLGIVILAMIVLPFAFKGKIKTILLEEVNSSVNAKINFGDIGLSLFTSFPDFSLSVEDLTVVGVDTFKLDTLASIKKLSLRLDLMSVIKGENYEIKNIILDEPKFLLKCLADTTILPNWDIAKVDTAAVVEDTTPSKFKMTLQKVAINNGTIIYDDATFPLRMELIGFNETLKGDMTADKTAIATDITVDVINMVFDGVKYLNKANAEINTVVDADLNKFEFVFKQGDLRLNELFLEMLGKFGMPAEGFDMDLTFKAKKNEFKNFLSLIPAVYATDFASIKTSGKLALDAYVKGMYTDTKMPAFGIKLLVENAMFQYPSLPKAVKNINIKTDITNPNGNPDATIVDVNLFHVEMAGNPFDLKLLLKTPVSDPNIMAMFKGRIDLNSVKEFYPLEKDQALSGIITTDIAVSGLMSSIEKQEYEKFKALGTLGISAMNYKSKDYPKGVRIDNLLMDMTPQMVNLKDLKVVMGSSDLAMNGRIDNLLGYVLKDETLKGIFNMSSKNFNLNEFMDTTTTETAEDTAALEVIPIPANLDIVLTSTFGKLIYDNMEMTNVNGVIKIKDAKATLENLSMNMLDGSILVNGFYDTKDLSAPAVDFGLDVKLIDVQKAFKTFNTVKKLAPIAERTTGKLSTKFTMKTLLDKTMMPVYKTLNGGGALLTNNVVVQNSKAFQKVGDALKMDDLKELVLNNVNVSFEFIEGRVFVKPFDVKMGGITSTIQGSNGFDQTLDYVMQMNIPRAKFGGAANNVLTGLVSQANSKGVTVAVSDVVKTNVMITGTVTDPKVSLGLKDAANDVAADMKAQAKAALDKKKAEAEAMARAEAEKAKAAAEARIKSETDAAKAKAKAEADKLKAEAEAKAKAEAQKAGSSIKKEAGKQLNNLLKK